MIADQPTGAAARRIDVAHLRAGDILFVYNKASAIGDRLGSFASAVGQRVLAAARRGDRVALRERIPAHAHVLLGLGGGVVIHADGKSVSMALVTEALQHALSGSMRVAIFRRRGLAPETAQTIAEAAVRYHNQQYSFASYFRGDDGDQDAAARDREDTTQFCSRLVAHAYRAAGEPLSALPDHKMLPVDLYQVCQSDDWEDVSAGLAEQADWSRMDDQLGPVTLPNDEQLTFSELMERADATANTIAQNALDRYEVQYTTVRQMIHIEGLLAQFVSTQFNLAKQLSLAPEHVDNDTARRIARVLSQLESLLATARLESVDALVVDSIVNTVEGGGDKGLYAGLPAPSIIRHMQKLREHVTIYTYLLYADIGLRTILAHRTPHAQFETHRRVDPSRADAFIAAFRPVADLTPYERPEALFAWVENDRDRSLSRSIVSNVVNMLHVIDVLRQAGARPD